MSNTFAFFLTRLLVLGILFSTAVNAAVVAKRKYMYLAFYFSDFSIIFFKSTKINNFFLSVSLIFFLDLIFLTNSLFTTLLSLLKPTGAVSNFFVSNLSASVFKLAKSYFDVPTPIAF